jgi:hypothetical protein
MDCATLRLKLAEAENALHNLAIGTQAQTLTFGPGKSVSYQQSNRADLQTYVNYLRSEVAKCDGKTPCRRGPVRFGF